MLQAISFEVHRRFENNFFFQMLVDTWQFMRIVFVMARFNDVPGN